MRLHRLQPVIDGEQIMEMRQVVRGVPIAPHVQEYVVRLVMATHPEGPGNALASKYIRYGSSPRGGQTLVLGGKIRALMNGRFNVSVEDVRALLLPALRHRIILNFEAQADGRNDGRPARGNRRQGTSRLRRLIERKGCAPAPSAAARENESRLTLGAVYCVFPLFSSDREFLKTLEQVSLLCRTNLAGTVGAGTAPAPKRAWVEFMDYRRYSLGDDPRSLDWKPPTCASANFSLKIYQTEQHIPVRILLDCSESMGCEGAAESKFVYAQRPLPPSPMWRCCTWTPSAGRSLRAAHEQALDDVRRTRTAFGRCSTFWEAFPVPARRTSFGAIKEFMGHFVSGGSEELYVISDFLRRPRMRTRGQAAVIGRPRLRIDSGVQHEEQKSSAEGEFILEDAETGIERVVECSSASTARLRTKASRVSPRICAQLALRNGGRYARAVTTIAYQDFVLRILQAGQVVA